MCSYRGLINLPHMFVSVIKKKKNLFKCHSVLKQRFDLKATYTNNVQVSSSKNKSSKRKIVFEMFFFLSNKIFFFVWFEFCLNKYLMGNIYTRRAEDRDDISITRKQPNIINAATSP